MLVVFASWSLLFAASWGLIRFLRIAQHSTDAESVSSDLYLGLSCYASILLALSIFAPVSWWAGSIIALPGLLAAIWRIRTIPHLAPTLCVLVPLATLAASSDVSFYDTGLYHQQATSWLSRYGLVDGLALVHYRLGFDSSWFALAAPFNHGGLAGREAAILGGLAPALLCATGVIILCRLRSTDLAVRGLTWIVFAVFLVSIAVIWNLQSSLSPDLMAWTLPLVAITMLTDDAVSPPKRLFRAALVCSLGCVIKLTALPALVYVGVSSALLLGATGTWRHIALSLAACSLPLGLGAYANFKLSGCPLFPSTAFCSDGPSSIGAANAIQVQDLIMGFTQSHGLFWTEMLPLGALAAIASLVALRTDFGNPFVRHGIGISWLGVLFVSTQAPNARYAMGYLTLAISIGLATVASRYLRRSNSKYWELSTSGKKATVAAGAFAMASGVTYILLDHTLLYPKRMPSRAHDPVLIVNRDRDEHRHFSVEWEGSTLAVARPTHSDQCWDADLPCTPGLTVPNVQLRVAGSGLGGGFVKVSDTLSILK